MKKKPDSIRPKVPEYKIKQVKDLVGLMDKKNTIMFASINGLPAAQFQKIKKELAKEQVDVLILKKRILLRGINGSKKQGLKNLERYVREDIAVIISDADSFELAEKLISNKNPVKAKAGQESPIDIEVESGSTDIPAGPAVSELGSLGLAVQVKSGKIEIIKPKVIVKKGNKISVEAASVMAKLNIMPFSVGFIPLASYDSKSSSLITELNIDKKGTVETMKQYFTKARGFAVAMGYICKETVKLLLIKASINEKALENLNKQGSKE